MRNAGLRVDFAMYLQALPRFARHLSVLAAPLLAAVVALLLDQIGQYMSDPLGGIGAGIYSMLAQLVYLFAFGVAVIQASNVWRQRKGSFDEAWDEARRKMGGIILAAIGFQFVMWVAALVGGYLGAFGLILQLIAAFFLIYTIPAAAIGGMPGQMAISASIRGVRTNPIAAGILAIVFVVLWLVLPQYLLPLFATHVSLFGLNIILAGIHAIILSYLAFPFAKQYDDIAFRGLW